MGSKKGYNWKARQVTSTIIDDSATKNITINLDGCKEHYDQSNLLVLPSKKRKTKIKETITKITKILSKKQRKRLEKIVDKKKKKENRSNLLDSLSKVQATPEELKKLTSIASIQTKGLKKLFQEELNPNKRKAKADQAVLSGDVQLNSLSGSKRRKVIEDDGVKTEVNKDPNVVGFESDSESDEDSHTSEEIVDHNKQKIEHTDNADIVVTNNLVDNHQKQKPRNTVLPAQDNSKMIVNKKIVNVEKNKKLLKKDKDCQIIEPQKEELHLIKKKSAVFVDVLRDKNIQKARLKLPILAEEQQIMEIINENSVIILAGETGSGKTTQVPQFLYEAGYALNKQIAVTQPRRVAAISMSKRVAEEMNLSSREVSYLIRFEGNATDETKIKFMTDGVLLKEVQTDFLLSKYSVVILDEAHERSVYTDILIGLLSRIVPLRHKRKDPLKLIIMSATLRLEDFTTNERLFKIPPPTIKVDARQFPVTIHFNKRTNENYLKEALNKVVKIHTKLPEGGILVFLTGQQEVNSLVKKLRTIFPLKNKSSLQDSTHKNRVKNANDHTKTSESSSDEENEKNYVGLKKPLKTKKKVVLPEIDLDDYSVPDDTDLHSENGSIVPSDDDSDDEISVISNAQPMWVLPLYSLLPTDKQARIFEATPAGYRLCVVSTNVAETSLTIPNVKYVVDSGKTKVKLYDKVTGVTSYMVSWTSKASANQRAGRAGRIGPGHCYRLYSSAIFNDEFTEYSEPEIQQKPVDDLFLQMKCMNIDKIINFPFPTAPNLLQLKTAEERLNIVGALKDGSVTPLGRAIAKFPVLPRYGKMLALSHQQNLLPYTVCLVAALSVQEVLLEVPTVAVSEDDLKNVRQKWAATRLQWAGHGNSLLLGDAIVLLKAVGAAEYAHSQGKIEKFCNDNGLRAKAVIEIRKLRHQLSNEIKMNLPEAEVIVDPKLTPPSDLQAKLLRQILLSGMGDQIAKKVYPDEIEDKEHKSKYKFAYHANNMKDYVYLHQGSVLKKTLPEFVIYQEIYETNKMYMRGVTAIEPEWLPVYVPSLCNLSEPLCDPKPTFQNGKVYCTVNGTFGNQAWTLPNIQMEFPKNIDCYKWFARFLLEGRVFSKFSKYTGVLLSQPNIMVKSWAKLHVRTDALLKALVARQCCDKESLEEAWHQNKNYLLDEYLKWLPESTHGEITLMWPPVN